MTNRLSWGTITRAERFMCFFITITQGPRVKICQQYMYNHPGSYTTDRSKAVFLVLFLFLFCVALWVLLRGVLG